LRQCIDHLEQRFSPATLFPQVPTVTFTYRGNRCGRCKKPLKVLKTHTKGSATLEIGSIRIHETIKHCDYCQRIYRSGEPRKLVAHGCTFGFDVLISVGMSMFVGCKSEKQIQSELRDRNVAVSIRQIGYLSKRFIAYLAIAHKEGRSKIKALFSARGGYILHLDGTCEGDSPHLMTALDEIVPLVLDNIKIPSEKADQIVPFLEGIKKCYGMPLALVHDMGVGILSAVRTVFPGVADYICHYHFLQDTGNDLYGIEYGRLRSELRKRGTRASLRRVAKGLEQEINLHPQLTENLDCYLKYPGESNVMPTVLAYILSNWVLDANSELNGYGFPFDRAHLVFYQRVKTARAIVGHLPASKKQDKHIVKLNRVLAPAVNDANLKTVVTRLVEKTEVFDRLRDAMRIGVPNGKKGLNDDGDNTDMKAIQTAVTAFRNSDQVRKAAEQDTDYNKMLKQIDKYWEKLFADPIKATTAGGDKILIQPQRTNNILERFFRDLKRMYRSKSGTQSLNKVIKAMLADTPLVRNLSNPEYVKIILKGHSTLEHRFAEIDEKLVRKQMATRNDRHCMPANMKKAMRKPVHPVRAYFVRCSA